MADIQFHVLSDVNNQKMGDLEWAAHGLVATAASGPFGKGGLPYGLYYAPKSKLLDKSGQIPYCDQIQPPNCWFQVLDPQFSTDRTDLGIHPDGNVVGTEGCIGLQIGDTSAWLAAFQSVVGHVTVEVLDET